MPAVTTGVLATGSSTSLASSDSCDASAYAATGASEKPMKGGRPRRRSLERWKAGARKLVSTMESAVKSCLVAMAQFRAEVARGVGMALAAAEREEGRYWMGLLEGTGMGFEA